MSIYKSILVQKNKIWNSTMVKSVHSESDKWMTVGEATQYIGVSKASLYTYMSDGRLPFYYIKGSKQRRIKKSDLDALLVRGKPEDVEKLEDSDG